MPTEFRALFEFGESATTLTAVCVCSRDKKTQHKQCGGASLGLQKCFIPWAAGWSSNPGSRFPGPGPFDGERVLADGMFDVRITNQKKMVANQEQHRKKYVPRHKHTHTHKMITHNLYNTFACRSHRNDGEKIKCSCTPIVGPLQFACRNPRQRQQRDKKEMEKHTPTGR